ncbi:MAG: hypothetical protein ACLU9S_12160 [Oscillospiraceae bacterium]
MEKDFVWTAFSGTNLSKYLIAESRKAGKIAAFLKPCDTYSFRSAFQGAPHSARQRLRRGRPVRGQCATCEADQGTGPKGRPRQSDGGGESSCAWTPSTARKTIAKADALPERCLYLQEQKMRLL